MACVEFHFDVVSPNAYLAHLLIPEIERRTGTAFEYVPVLLGGVFKATGNVPAALARPAVRNKPEYEQREMQRFIDRHGLGDEFRWNPAFPVDTLRIMRGATAARRLDPEIYRHFVNTAFEAMWRYPRNLQEPEIITETLRAAGLPAGDILAAMRAPEIKAELRSTTEQAVDRGVFGVPSFFVGDELYFGRDTLWQVEEALRGTGSAAAAC